MAAHIVPADKEKEAVSAEVNEEFISSGHAPLKEKSPSGKTEVTAKMKKTSTSSEATTRIKGVKSFSRAAHKMITELSDTHPNVASWSESGDMIVITHKKEFVQHLPRFFNHRQYESFSKQLNVYGFKQIGPEWEIVNGIPQLIPKTAPTRGIRHNENIYRFWHPHFHRDGADELYKVLPAKASTGHSKKERKVDVSDTDIYDPSEDAEVLRAKVAFLKEQIAGVKREMNEKVLALEQRYKAGVRKLSRELETACAGRLEGQPISRPSLVPSCKNVEPKQLDANMSNNTDDICQEAPMDLYREWSDPSSKPGAAPEPSRGSPMPEWPPPDSGVEKFGRVTTFELSEPILFHEEGLNACTLNLDYAEI